MRPSQPSSDAGATLRALVLLVLLLGTVFFQLLVSNRLEAVRVPDTPSYMEASRASSLKAALSTHRTVGFPTLIRALHALGASTRVIPVLGILLYFFGTLLFFFAVLRFSGSPWFAFAASVPLPFAGVMTLVELLQPDFISAALVLVSVSCLLLVVTNRRNWAAWVGLGLGVALAYQFRPASQFLVLLVPILAGVFLGLYEESRVRRMLGLTAITAAVTVTPFLLFCTLRAVTVGSFGLVSFGGSNLAASVVNFLDTDLVQEVPADYRDMARRILRQRRQRGWETMTLESDPVEYFRQGSDNLFRIARNVAKQESRKASRQAESSPRDPEISINVDLDRRLTGLASEIIHLRPALYLNWIRHSFMYGLRQLTDYAWIWVPFVLLILSLPIAWIRRRSRKGVPAEQIVPVPFSGNRAANVTMLGTLAFGYFVTYLLLVSMVFFPFDRYFVSLTLFLPSALLAGLFEIWRDILQLR